MRILLVEDEIRLAEALEQILKKQGHVVDLACDGAVGQEMGETGIYDVIILDRNLPHIEGVDVLKHLRRAEITTPVILLTAKDTVSNRVEGLDAGADLLTLSRADTNQQTLDVQPFVLKEAVSEALASFEPIANEKKIDLKVNLADPFIFHGDRNRIKQLCVILVDNALQYTDSGSVTVSLTQNEKETTLMFSDTGHGIEAEHINNIFDRFYRVEKTRTSNQSGSGLGLAIAKWFVEEHGGIIKVESTLDVGTTFTVHFPH